MTQLAQITQVEQTYNINTNLQSLLSSQNNAGSISSVSFIGKQVTAQGSQFTQTSGSPSTLGFTLPSDAAQVSMQISDASGSKVRTLTQGPTSAGAGSMVWDGLNDAGQTLPTGTYSFAVAGTDATGQTIQGTTLVQGQVTGVNLSGTTPVLTVNGQSVPITSIVAVR